jgi:glutaredoxin 3
MKPVRIYTKTDCPYSLRAKQLLAAKGVLFDEVDVEQQPERYDEMVAASRGGTSTPQIFISGQHVGGAEDLERLDTSGALDHLLIDEVFPTL